MRYVAYTLGCLAVLIGLPWIVMGNDFYLYKVLAPRQEQVRREVFEQTKSYNDGMVQEIRAMQFDYEKAAPTQRAALASIILHRTANYDETMMPSDVRSFVSGLRSGR